MMVRRIVAALLANVMLFTTSVQTITAGAEAKKSAAESVSLSNNEINVESTNSFGSILAKEMSAEQAKQLANNGCNVFSIEMDGTQANVEFQTVVDCTLVVGVYDESGETLLAVGSTEVLHDQTNATVSIGMDAMPAYFYLKGYLIDSLGLTPMCTVYQNPNYTQKMQEFFSKTVDDFDAERVLNFDDDLTNNFAVYEESTIIIPQNNEGYNVVASADDTACVYVIENADDSVLSLEEGDIFAYQYGEDDLLIARIAQMEVDGTTVTITGGGVSMDEIFEYVRIDIQQNMDDAEITPVEGAEVVDENADVIKEPSSNQTTPSAKLSKANEPIDEDSDYLDGLTEGGAAISISFPRKEQSGDDKDNADKDDDNKDNANKDDDNKDDDKKDDEDEDDYFFGDWDLTGTVALKAGVSLRKYVADDINYTEVLLGFSLEFDITLEGTGGLKVPFSDKITFPAILGVTIAVQPALVLRVDGNLVLSGKLYGSKGTRFNEDDGTTEDISRSPLTKFEIKSEVSLFIGVDLQPQVSIISKYILSLKFNCEVGVEAVGKWEKSIESRPNELNTFHTCKKCIDGNFNLKFTLDAELTIAGGLFIDPIKVYVPNKITKFADFYWSLDYKEFEVSRCPHFLYKVEITCIDTRLLPAENANLTFSSPDQVMVQTSTNSCSPLEGSLLTNADGKAVVFVGEGTTTVHVTKERFKDRSSNINLNVGSGGIVKINDVKTNQHEIKLSPVEHKVSIHVTDEAGEPLSMVKISKTASTEYTDMDGNAELELSNGTYELTVSKNSYRTQTHTITIFDEGQHLTFKLVAMPDLSVRVTDEDGQPLQNATVLISGIYQPTTRTDAEGICGIELVAGSYTMIVSKENYETKECAFTFTGDPQQLDVVLKCTLPKVTVTVEDKQGKRIAGASVTYEGSEDTVLTGANGTAVLRIPQGNCTIKASAKGYRSKSQTCTVEAEGTEVTIVLSPMMIRVSTIGYGNAHYAAITSEGALYMKGVNYNGQLGNGTWRDSDVFCKILDNVLSVSLGYDHSAAITNDGSLYLWGKNHKGQLGNGTEENSSAPIKIMENVIAVSLGNAHSAAITEDGSLYVWGDNYLGQIGNGNDENCSTPIKIMDNVTAVSLGEYHSAAITEDGSLYMWGANDEGQLGNGNTMFTFTPIKIMDNVASVSLGNKHSAAITNNGSLYMWGTNGSGMLGDGTLEDRHTPFKIMDDVTAVSLGFYNSAAITEDGHLYMWGNYNLPRRIMDNVAAVCLGSGANALTVTEDGSLYSCYNTPVKIMDGVAIGGNTSATSFTTEALFTVAKSAAPIAKRGAATTKSYTNLLPKTLYNFYVLRSDTAEDLLSADNLLYLNQYVSASDGKLSITYTPIEEVTDAVLLAVPAQRTISDASIVLEDMVYDGTAQTASPVVTYGGVTLTEDADYTLSGDTTADAVGAYMLTITGKGDYSGELTVSYWMYCEHSYADGVCTICETQCVHTYENGLCSVCGDTLPITTTTLTTTTTTTTSTSTSPPTTTEPAYLLGDVNCDGSVDSSDASLVLAEYAKIQTGGAGEFTETQHKAADVNNDSVVDSSDASKILAYYAMISTGKEPTWD